MQRMGLLGALILTAGCASSQQQARATASPSQTLVARSAARAGPAVQPTRRSYRDATLGFEIARPEGSWQLDVTDEVSPEGLTVPVVLRDRQTGAQVILQIAPAIASPTQFAERLTAGLRSHPGFSADDPAPLALSENAVGFRFAMGEQLRGKVAVLEGASGQVFMMMATWPADAPSSADQGVEEIFGSLRAIPRT